MHQQGLRRVANRRILHLRVVGNVRRLSRCRRRDRRTRDKFPRRVPEPESGCACMMCFTSSYEPRGMIRSTSRSSDRSSSTSARDCSRLMESAGTPWKPTQALRARWIRALRLFRAASEPPFRITALPDFRASEATCGTTSGRDSKITPTTPSGHDSLYSTKPSSSSVAASCRPEDPGDAATSRICVAICATPRSRHAQARQHRRRTFSRTPPQVPRRGSRARSHRRIRCCAVFDRIRRGHQNFRCERLPKACASAREAALARRAVAATRRIVRLHCGMAVVGWLMFSAVTRYYRASREPAKSQLCRPKHCVLFAENFSASSLAQLAIPRANSRPSESTMLTTSMDANWFSTRTIPDASRLAFP